MVQHANATVQPSRHAWAVRRQSIAKLEPLMPLNEWPTHNCRTERRQHPAKQLMAIKMRIAAIRYAIPMFQHTHALSSLHPALDHHVAQLCNPPIAAVRLLILIYIYHLRLQKTLPVMTRCHHYPRRHRSVSTSTLHMFDSKQRMLQAKLPDESVDYHIVTTAPGYSFQQVAHRVSMSDVQHNNKIPEAPTSSGRCEEQQDFDVRRCYYFCGRLALTTLSAPLMLR